MDFTRLKTLVVPEGVVKKIEIGGRTVWEKGTTIHYLESALGSSLTSAQSTAIRAGDFTNIPVGGYWTFSNVRYSYVNEANVTVSDTYSGTMRAADCDYYLNIGDTPLTTHHVVVVPDTSMYSARMNDTRTAAGGYVGSKMRTTYLKRAKAIFNACFGTSHVLSHREFLTNTINEYDEIAGAWYDSTVELMDNMMVFKRYSFANRVGKQLSLFENNPSLKTDGNICWLSNATSYTHFDTIYKNGTQSDSPANYSYGVRPYALIY